MIDRKSNTELTYATIQKKLDKKFGKRYANDLESCLRHFETEIESGSLIASVRSGGKTTAASSSKVDGVKTTTATTSQAISGSAAAGTITAATTTSEQQQQTTAASTPTTDDGSEPGVLRRFPSLTWRQANERARILFYKGRTPSIHYNEKRDSFRVSMLAEMIKDGQHKVTEVPVTDDDVRRLLNSFGLYWDGESISLLNKSDEIFAMAQQEAFDSILSGAAAAAAAETIMNAAPTVPADSPAADSVSPASVAENNENSAAATAPEAAESKSDAQKDAEKQPDEEEKIPATSDESQETKKDEEFKLTLIA